MTTPTIPVDDFTVFLPFTKVSELGDGTIRVHSVINDETVDDQGEILDYLGTKAALDDFMKFANVREMHQASAVGIVESITHDDLAKTSEGILHVVDPTAVSKVLAKVYKGTSLGGAKGPIRTMEKVGGAKVTRLSQPYVTEISLVDRPSRPTAVMTLLKRSDVAEEVPVATETPTAEAATDATAAQADAQPDAAAETPAAEAEGATPDVALSETAAVAPEAAATPVEAPPAETQLAQAAATGDLAKAAASDAWDMASEAGYLLTLAEREEKEGDTEGAARIKRIAQELLGEAATEAEEVGTPENAAQLEAEAEAADADVVVVVDPFYYSAVTGDLAKRALTLAKAGGTAPEPDPQLDTLIGLAKAAGGRCEHDITPTVEAAAPSGEVLAKIADAALERASDQLMTKVSQAIGPMVRPDQLEAMKAEVVGLLQPMKDVLAKIAAQPAPGGPVRYATDGRRFGDLGESGITPAIEAEVLRKVADSATDPSQKEALGLAAATALIRADQAAR